MSKQFLPFLTAAIPLQTKLTKQLFFSCFILCCLAVQLPATANTSLSNHPSNDGAFTNSIILLDLVADLNDDGDTDDANEIETDGAGIPNSFYGNGIVDVETCNSDIPNQFLKAQIRCAGCPDDAAYEYDLSINDFDLIATNVYIDFNPTIIPLDGTDLKIGDNQVTVELYELFGGSRTLVDTRTFNFIVTTMEVLACNDEVIIGINSECSSVITADALIEAPCQTLNGETLESDYLLDFKLLSVAEDFVNSRSIPMPGILNNNSDAVTLQIPGRYRYSITLGDNTCWGFVTLEDKRGPVCDPALDVEVRVDWDHDCDPSTSPVRRPDPSGIDDLASEYILCEILEREGVDIFFDELEAEDGFVDYDNDGVQDSNEPSFRGDFQDCSGIKEIFYNDEELEVCTLEDLNSIPIDITKYDVDRYEICSIYTRTWFAVDNSGRQSATGCTQYVFGLRPKLSVIEIDAEASVECGVDLDERATFPYYNVRSGDIFNNGAGSVNSFPFEKEYQLIPFQNRCKYSVSYHEDPQIPICGTESDAYKQNRHWSVADWCDGERIYDEFTQLIKVEDTTPPVACLVGTEAYLPTDTTIVTQIFDCTAEGNIPELYLKDACSTSSFYEIVIVGMEEGSHSENGVFIPNLSNGADITSLGLRDGNYRIIYRFEDVCGNRDEVSINLDFIDPRFPQAICNDELHVTLIPTGVNDEQQARVYAEDLDDTSSDNCHPLIYEVRLSGGDEEWLEYVEFDCSHIGDPVEVILRVTGDANNNGRVDEGELSSMCWSYITLEDNSAPQINVNDASFFCDDPEFNQILIDAGDYEPNSRFLFPTVLGNCNPDGITIRLINIDFTNYDPVCKVGEITRDFVAFRNSNGHQFSSQIVTQTISVLFRSDWTMKFPTDMIVECDPTIENSLESIPAPLEIEEILTNRACDQWAMETKDEIFDILGQDGNGACYKVIRTYKFINWCTWDPTNTETGIVPRPLDFFTNSDLCVTLDYMSDPVSNICELQNKIDDRFERDNDPYDLVFGNNGNNQVDLISELDADFIYVDENFPNGGNDFFGEGDCILDGFNSSFNSAVDHAPTTFNALIDDQQHHNFVSAEAYGYFVYRQVIKVVDNTAPEIVQIEDVEICDESNTCIVNYKLPVPEVTECKDTYTITYQIDINRDGDTNDGNENGRILGNAIDGFTTPLLNSLTYGTYTITYLVNDGCGNVSKMEFNLTAKDCKPPVAYCRGVVLELMPTGMVELWAKDLDAGSFDTCEEDITFSFNAAGTETSRTFTCLNLGTQAVQLFVTDELGNQSICEAFVIIQSDNLEAECGDFLDPLITGHVTTEMGDDVEGSMISINGTMDMEMPTDVHGGFSMTVERGGDYSISAQKDVQPLNGVSSFDMVLIRKHILGLQPLNSPYKLIAADVNNSRSITTLDMVQLRRLILGVDTEFENNTSWRFVDASYLFPDTNNPWIEAFPEVVNINNLDAQAATANFVAIKTGDVNDSAIPNSLLEVDERNQRSTWSIEVQDKELQNGNTYEIPFYATDTAIEGYQFTLNLDLDKVELVDIKSGSASEENFGTVLLDEGKITASWVGDNLPTNDQPLFTLVLKSSQNALLSQTMEITSDFTKAEAYPLTDSAKNISLNFIFGTNIEHIYMLAQNSPNPFNDQTTVRFTLPKATTAVLTITDVSGKIVWKYEGTFDAGVQSITVDKADLKSNGIFFYHLQADDFQATRRMINLAK